MSEYFLLKHVYFCCRGDSVVFLDLENDQYSMIDGDKGKAFQVFCRISTSPGSLNSSVQILGSDSVWSEVLHELIDNALITTDKSIGKSIAPTVFGIPVAHLINPSADSDVAVRMQHVYRFLKACTWAAIQLRFRSLIATVRSIERRKELKSVKHPFDWEKARRLVVVFNRLRCTFPANYLCLFDSLALIEFLALYDLFPSWVFGVRPELWAAHCWVQEKQTVFNEEVEHTEDYEPIMVV